jgi:hypothetical protein
MDTRKNLTAAEVTTILTEAGVDLSELTITDDPTVWADFETGAQGTSVRIDGPKEARRAATSVLFGRYLAQAPYPDHDFWSR